jgi:hypothetical protein
MASNPCLTLFHHSRQKKIGNPGLTQVLELLLGIYSLAQSAEEIPRISGKLETLLTKV